MKNPTNNNLLLPLIFLCIATPFFLAAIGVTISSVKFFANSDIVDGRIVQILAATGDLRLGKRALTPVDDPTSTTGDYYPVIEYSRNGHTERIRQKAKTNIPPEIGAVVHVRISRLDSSDARVDGFTELWFLPTLMLAVSTPLVLLGIFLLRSAMTRNRLLATLPTLGQRIECSNLTLGPNPYVIENGKHPQRISARFQVAGNEYLCNGPSFWDHPPLPESVTILYHPDDPDVNVMQDDSILPRKS